MREFPNLHFFLANNNLLQGALPALASPTLVLALANQNAMSGSIPPSLLGSASRHFQGLGASGLAHEGSIPSSATRMTHTDLLLIFGQGLRGVLPKIPGTFFAASLWQNSLNGQLPELRIKDDSTVNVTVLVHANHFSCKLPRNGDVEPAASLALIGNRFTQPKGAFPAWIKRVEQGS
eukprot:174082-Amphidinium_carterae.1